MKYLNYILIAVGAFVAMYAKTNAEQNQYVLIGGIVVLMIGIYRVAKTVPSKTEREEVENNDDEAL
ncbi:hypothetical protein Q4566_15165 [Tamlana sp. 2_MG-2023]|uniref:hypothetical protein n=1 Tax=unclassified Tamlana TaxID=2614803 RepID=UPI0026E14CDC|nr:MULTISPECIES: hypothetical protein [unclassified Tamlana]MDO6761551.1 hypothetical protein [Tamlana sp. 2_MG-2023]MDO6792319.1 hypothetical protein [Tamlana sp. 1_MG-2023]